jgi:hypothetical protein
MARRCDKRRPLEKRSGATDRLTGEPRWQIVAAGGPTVHFREGGGIRIPSRKAPQAVPPRAGGHLALKRPERQRRVVSLVRVARVAHKGSTAGSLWPAWAHVDNPHNRGISGHRR